jgi:hypothetical protein
MDPRARERNRYWAAIIRIHSVKTYYLTSFWKYYSLVSGSILFWFALAAMAYQVKFFDFVFVASILCLGDVASAFHHAPTAHIVVSKNGVLWRSFGFTLSTSWEDIERISYHVYGLSIQEGLAATRLKLQIHKTGIGCLPTPWQTPPFKPFIPLSCFVHNWRNSELGGQIKQYAPHLF